MHGAPGVAQLTVANRGPEKNPKKLMATEAAMMLGTLFSHALDSATGGNRALRDFELTARRPTEKRCRARHKGGSFSFHLGDR